MFDPGVAVGGGIVLFITLWYSSVGTANRLIVVDYLPPVPVTLLLVIMTSIGGSIYLLIFALLKMILLTLSESG